MIIRFTLFLFLLLSIISCSSDEVDPLVSEFPKTFVFDEASTTGMRTYYYTDTIIYRVDNLQDLDSISMDLDSVVASTILANGSNNDEFAITQITFESATDLSITYYANGATAPTTQSASYILEQNRGSFDAPFLFNFIVNEDLTNLRSCYSHIATRKIDTLFLGQDDLIATLDTLSEDDLQFQLIPSDGPFVEGYCNPTNESTEMELYANENGIINNDRIIIHRMDLLFKPE